MIDKEVLKEKLNNDSVEKLAEWLSSYIPHGYAPRDFRCGGDFLNELISSLKKSIDDKYLLKIGDACSLILQRWIKKPENERDEIDVAVLYHTLVFMEGYNSSNPDNLAEVIISLLNNPKWYEKRSREYNDLEARLLLVLAGALWQCSDPKKYISVYEKVISFIDVYQGPVINCILYLDEEKFFVILPGVINKMANPELILIGLFIILKEKPELLQTYKEIFSAQGWNKHIKEENLQKYLD